MKKQDTFDASGKRLAVYSRVSTAKQDNEAQDLAIRKYLENKEWTWDYWFTEKISGKKDRRPERDKLLSLCRQGEIKSILVWKLSRWGRSSVDVIQTLKELHSIGVNVLSVTENIDQTTPSGRAMTSMMAIFSELDREIINEQMWLGRLRYREENGNLGGRRPRAMEKTPEVLALKEAKGWSISRIAEHLSISPSSVRRILKSQTSGEQT
jgi:putative DNA-invertase from lambdoid prophage Rac